MTQSTTQETPRRVSTDSSAVASHLHPRGSFDPADHPVPNGREEVWRFTPIKRLRELHADRPLDGSDYTVDVSADPVVETGVVACDDEAKGSSGYVPVDRVSARAWQAADKTFVVTIPREQVAPEPTIVTLRGAGVARAAAGHLVVRAEPFSSATVVVVHEGSAVFADNVELVVGEGATLRFVSIQDWADDAVHVTHHHALVGRDAVLHHSAVSLGGDVVRMSVSVAYDGTGGQVDMLGLYFADQGQHLEHRLFVDHNAPRTRSRVDYKGALQGAGAHTVWIGDVLIRKVAEGIDTYESNNNLVLTDGCRADSVPNLEIETGEIIGAGHASTTGRFDDEQLFYLQSRGIPDEEARRLVVHGFFADIVRRIGVPQIEPRLMQAIEQELEANIGLAPASAAGA
ncbi:MAG: Fe-S cluster assembly protein SufD [Nocardioidaceae bacterium]